MLDKHNQRIVRYDIPNELSSLSMSEQLFIRRCAPFIPMLHVGKGNFRIKGHCVAFSQDITEICKTLPQKPECIVVFIRQMRNVPKAPVRSQNKMFGSLRWLKLYITRDTMI